MDFKKASYYYEQVPKSCDKYYSDAQYTLGFMSRKGGCGVEKNDVKAIEHFHVAADCKNPYTKAMIDLAVHYNKLSKVCDARGIFIFNKLRKASFIKNSDYYFDKSIE